MVIETPFMLCDTTGEWHEFHPGTGSGLATVLNLFMKAITAAAAEPVGQSLTCRESLVTLGDEQPGSIAVRCADVPMSR
jgi:hypothetical protein